jgi:predicted RNA-binding protein with PIN domain
VAEAVGALERDLDALRRATGLAEDGKGRGSGGPPGAGGSSGGAGTGAARRPERRSPLAVPGGRGADDPETLASWMGVDGVLVLVDGYNVTKHPQGFPDRGLEDQRTLLLDLCRRLARRFGAEITVVFDGGTVGPLPTRLPLGPVEVVFTDAGRSADDEIVARTNAAPPERPVVVVTSDNELRARVSTLGATVTRSPALLGLATAR